MTQTWGVDEADVPVGTVLPFRPGEVPAGWVEWDGGLVTRDRWPDLFEIFDWTHTVEQFFNTLGGGKNDEDTWQTPELSGTAAWGAFNMPDMGPVVVAQKAQRTVSSDAADSETSEVRHDDSEDGQPGQ